MTKALIAGFGAIFSDIHIIRRKKDTVRGVALQDIKVPISYSPKSKWWQGIEIDPAREKQVYATFPRMAYEITGFSYDASRKQTRSAVATCVGKNGKAYTISTPAPWNLDISLYIVSNNQEDCFQVVEQILPLFNPDYTITIESVSEMNITTNIPVSLSGISVQDDYEGEFTTHRLVMYTLSFVVKALYYGEAIEQGIINDVSLNTISNGSKENIRTYYDSETGQIKLVIDGSVTEIDNSLNEKLSNDPSYDKSPNVFFTEDSADYEVRSKTGNNF